MIKIKNMYKIYTMGDNEVRALDGISLDIEHHEFTAIVGQSGSGKSTLMNMIGCLDTPTSGEYYIDGKEVSKLRDDQQAAIRNEKIGFIFQQYNLLPKLNVLENVELPLIYMGIPYKKRMEMCREALEQVSMTDRMDHKPSELSGGQQQRVAIARALATKPPMILADEPTGALDSKTGKEVLETLKNLHKDGKTIVLITHDNDIAAQAERVVRLADGVIVSDTKSN
ncbi:MAG: ABC transporter ATP-binding protein [Oscillospiraceae bacterium]|nr:ABC transporter ATP-binding protein [Oscillospiraceae bacterium]